MLRCEKPVSQIMTQMNRRLFSGIIELSTVLYDSTVNNVFLAIKVCTPTRGVSYSGQKRRSRFVFTFTLPVALPSKHLTSAVARQFDDHFCLLL